jgi:hypothetical protein
MTVKCLQFARAALPRASRRARSLLPNESGATAIMAAMLFPIVVGGMGLGAETGYWYLTQRKLQHAADVSVHAAAMRRISGDQKAGMEQAALLVARDSGFQPGRGTLMVNTPPLSGAYTGNRNSIELILSENHKRLFSAVYSAEPVTIKARAVAQVNGGGKACVLALSPTRSGAVTTTGSTSVDLSNCNVASNSNAQDSYLLSGSSAAMATDCVHTVGGAVTTSGLTLRQCRAVRDYAPKTVDPYAEVAEPANVGTCRNRNVGNPGNTTTLTPTENHPSGVKVMRFCGGLDVKGTVVFEPGLYIIDGGTFTTNGGDPNSTAQVQVRGSGVTFYFANNAAVRLTGNVTQNISAPTTGPYSGILFFGSRNATSVTHQVGGSSSSTFQWALYTSASAMEYRGNSTVTDGCTQIVADRITFTGNSTMRSACEQAGTRDILVGQVVKIVE